jgi:putative transcriptional regulator
MAISKLKLARMNRGITQKELAELAGISEQMICFYETDRAKPMPATRHQLAKALETTPEELFPECY